MASPFAMPQMAPCPMQYRTAQPGPACPASPACPQARTAPQISSPTTPAKTNPSSGHRVSYKRRPLSSALPYALAGLHQLNDWSVPDTTQSSCQIAFDPSAKPRGMMHPALHCTTHASELRSWVLVSARLQDLIETFNTRLCSCLCLCIPCHICHGSSLFTVERGT